MDIHPRSRKSADREPLQVKSYCLIVRILAQCRCYPAILDVRNPYPDFAVFSDTAYSPKLSTLIIKLTSSQSLILVILDTIRIHSDVWSSMDVVDHIVHIFSTVQESCELRGLPSKALLIFLKDMREMKQLTHALDPNSVLSPVKVITSFLTIYHSKDDMLYVRRRHNQRILPF